MDLFQELLPVPVFANSAFISVGLHDSEGFFENAPLFLFFFGASVFAGTLNTV